VVAREAQEVELDAVIVHLRARYGTRTITRGSGGAARELLRASRDGGALGMLIDQDTKVEGVFVPFFGRDAWTPVGAAQLAIKRGLAVLPIFAERRDDGRHCVRVGGPLALGSDAQELTARMTLAIEEQVRRCPAQWVWMHRRWRRRPVAAHPEAARPESVGAPG
jgi:KDO2-lipid IV(A) lauroyltransferase